MQVASAPPPPDDVVKVTVYGTPKGAANFTVVGEGRGEFSDCGTNVVAEFFAYSSPHAGMTRWDCVKALKGVGNWVCPEGEEGPPKADGHMHAGSFCFWAERVDPAAAPLGTIFCRYRHALKGMWPIRRDPDPSTAVGPSAFTDSAWTMKFALKPAPPPLYYVEEQRAARAREERIREERAREERIREERLREERRIRNERRRAEELEQEQKRHHRQAEELCGGLVYGARVVLLHVGTGTRLHSHPHRYPEGSQQQQVTGFAHHDENDWWMVKPAHGVAATLRGPVADGAVIRLEHCATRRNLHSHRGHRSAVTGQQEVTAFGDGGNGDSNDNWRVVFTAGGLRLQHANTATGDNSYLHSHRHAYPDWGFGQQEVTVFGGRDGNDVFRVERHDPPRHAQRPPARPHPAAEHADPHSAAWTAGALVGDFINGLAGCHADHHAPPPRQQCPSCGGKGGFDTWGRPCAAHGLPRRKAECALCRGAGMVDGAWESCTRCGGKGGFDTWDKPCRPTNMHRERGCGACDSKGYTPQPP